MPRPSIGKQYVSPDMKASAGVQGRGRPRTRLRSVNDIAAYLSISRTTLYALIDEGLPAIRVGFYRRFDRVAVMRWLSDRQKRRQAEGLE